MSQCKSRSHSANLEHFHQLFAVWVDEVCRLFSTFVLCLDTGSYWQQISGVKHGEGWGGGFVKGRLSVVTKTYHSLLLQPQLFFLSSIDSLSRSQNMRFLNLRSSNGLMHFKIQHLRPLSPLAWPTAEFYFFLHLYYLVKLLVSDHFTPIACTNRKHEIFKDASLLGDLWVAVAAGHVKWGPAVFVPLMDIGAVLHQQLHHIQIPREHRFM